MGGFKHQYNAYKYLAGELERPHYIYQAISSQSSQNTPFRSSRVNDLAEQIVEHCLETEGFNINNPPSLVFEFCYGFEFTSPCSAMVNNYREVKRLEAISEEDQNNFLSAVSKKIESYQT